MRLRVQLDKVLAKELPVHQQLHKFWWQPSAGLQTVGHLLDELASHLAWHAGSAQLLAEVDGFAVLPSSSLGVLREGDLLTLKHNPRKRKAAPAAEPAAQHAGKKPKLGQGLARAAGGQQGKPKQQQQRQQGRQLQRQPQQEQGSGSPSGDSSSSEDSESEQKSKSSPESSSASESSPDSSEGAAQQQTDVDAKSEHFYTPAAKLASPGNQQAAAAGEGPGPGGPDTGGAATGGAGAGKPRPSRSARRKAAKRRLKREGLLPPSTGKKGTAQQQQQRQQQQGQQLQQKPPGETGGGAPAVAIVAAAAAARGGDKTLATAGLGAQPAKRQRKQKQQMPSANGFTRPAAGLVAAPAADACTPQPAVLKQPARHAGISLAPTPPPGKAAAVAKAAQRKPAAADVGSMLHASGLKARNITPDGHVYFGGDSSSSGESESSSDDESDGEEAAQQQVEEVSPRRNAADLVVAQTAGDFLQQAKDGAGAAAAGAAASAGAVMREMAALPGPMTELDFAELPAVLGMPSVGSVVAYKLLEIGPSFAPQVSEVRLGRIVEADGQSQSLTLEPHPDPATHPLAWQWAAARAVKAAEAAAGGDEGDEGDEEEEEQELGLYEEDGALAAELSSFVELRLVEAPAALRMDLVAQAGVPAAAAAPPMVTVSQAAREPAPAAHAAATETAKPSVGVDMALEDLGPSSYSQLGPPHPAATTGGTVIPAEGGWASLHQQLQQRRAELARQQQRQQKQRQAGAGSGAPQSGTPANSNGQQLVQSPLERPQRPPQQQGASRPATAAAASPAGTHAGQARGGSKRLQGLTPGATKPRGGVRASAMGPILRMLRSSNELE